MQRIRNGWWLTRNCWRVIAASPSLLVFPAVGFTVSATVLTLLFVLVGGTPHHGRWPVSDLLWFALAAYPLSLVNTFLNVALVRVACGRLRGEQPTLRDGWRCAASRVGVIARWALLATGVGVILQVLVHLRGGWLAGRLAALTVGASWSVLAMLAIPVIAIEELGPLDAARRSAALIKRRWGEGVTGATTIAGAFILTSFVFTSVLLAGVAVSIHHPAAGVPIVILAAAAWLANVILASTTGQLFGVVLYRYAAHATVSGGFTESQLNNAFAAHRRRGLLRRLRRR